MINAIEELGNPMFNRETTTLGLLMADFEEHQLIDKAQVLAEQEKLVEIGTLRQKSKLSFRSCLCPQFLLGLFSADRSGQRV